MTKDVSQPTVGVVIVTHNSVDVIDGLLETLGPALGDLSSVVAVVDCGSTDETVTVLERRADLTITACANLGYAAGINRGVASLPPTETILVLNPDVRLASDSVPTMLSRMRATGAGVVAPRTLRPDGSLTHSLGRVPTLPRAAGLSFTGIPMLSERFTSEADYEHPRVVDWAVGAVLLVSRACHEALGGWDESFFLYSEETDFSLRASDNGFLTHYEPTAVAVHSGGASGRSGETHAMQALNRVRLYARRHSAISAWAYFGLTVLGEVRSMTRGNPLSRRAVDALIHPERRPVALGLGGSLLPTAKVSAEVGRAG